MTTKPSRYRIAFDKWLNLNGYRLEDNYAVLSYLQYLEIACTHPCTELQTTDEGIVTVCLCCGVRLGKARMKVHGNGGAKAQPAPGGDR